MIEQKGSTSESFVSFLQLTQKDAKNGTHRLFSQTMTLNKMVGDCQRFMSQERELFATRNGFSRNSSFLLFLKRDLGPDFKCPFITFIISTQVLRGLVKREVIRQRVCLFLANNTTKVLKMELFPKLRLVGYFLVVRGRTTLDPFSPLVHLYIYSLEDECSSKEVRINKTSRLENRDSGRHGLAMVVT